MDEQASTEVTEPKKPPRKQQRRKRIARPAAPHDELDGFTQGDCGFDCTEKRCVITHVNVCGHPYKGGIQAALQAKTDVIRRYNMVRKALAHQMLDRKG